jgi:hypothetical protein
MDQQNPSDPNQNLTQNSQPTEFEILSRQVAQLTQSMGQMAQMIQQPQQPQIPQQPSYNFNPEDWQDPSKAPVMVAEIVARENAKAMAPMLEFRNQINRQNQYQSIKAGVKSMNQNFARFWQHIEPVLDQTFGSGNVDVNQQLVAYQAQAILGGLFIQNPALLNSTPSAPQMISPSGAPAPSNIPNTPPLRSLDENEEQLRKARGLTHEEYLKLQAGSSMLLSPSSDKGKK